MRRIVPFGFMAILLLFPVPGLEAQDVSGTWTLTYSMMGRQGGQAREVSMDVTFTQEGSAVSGTALMAMGGRRGGGGEPQPIPLSDVELEGDKLTFTVTRGQGERSFSFVFNGTVAGTAMEGTMTRSGGMRGGGQPTPFKGVKKEG